MTAPEQGRIVLVLCWALMALTTVMIAAISGSSAAPTVYGLALTVLLFAWWWTG